MPAATLPPSRRARRALLPLAAAATLLAGCASGGGTVTPGDGSPTAGPSDGGTPREIVMPAPLDTLILQVRDEGGFVPYGYDLVRLPQMSIYVDGRVIELGAQLAIYPAPLLPPIVVSRIPPLQVERLLAEAYELGFGSGTDRSFPATTVADAPDTVVVVWGEGGYTRTGFGALGIEGSAPAEEAELRRVATDFIGSLPFGSVAPEGVELTEAGPYVPTALRLVVTPYVESPDFPQEPVAWPIDVMLGAAGVELIPEQPEAGRCMVVLEGDVATLWPVLEAANQLTPFEQDGVRYTVQVRPLLPHEEAICP